MRRPSSTRHHGTISVLIFTLIFSQAAHFPRAAAEEQPRISPAATALDGEKPKSIEEFDLPLLRRAATTGQVRHSLDKFDLLRQELFYQRGLIKPSEIQIDILGESGQVLDSLDPTRKTALSSTEPFSFAISRQGETIYRFSIPTRSIARIGNYIVFIETDHQFSDHREVRFIDLNYFGIALGKTELPVFSITATGTDALDGLAKLELKTWEVRSRGQRAFRLNETILHSYSGLQRMLFNMAVLYTDPKESARIGPLMDEFSMGLERVLELQSASVNENLKQISGSTERLTAELKAAAHADQSLASESIDKVLQVSQLTGLIGKNMAEQGRWMNRMKLLLAYAQIDRPLSSPSLVKALHHVAWGYMDRSEYSMENFKQTIRHLAHSGNLRRAFFLSTVGAVAIAYPDFASRFFLESMNLTSTMVDVALGRLGNLAHLAGLAAAANVNGFKFFFSDILFSSTKLFRLIAGTTIFMGLLTFSLMLPHVLVQGFKLWRDLRDGWKDYDLRESMLRSQFKEAFVLRQRQLEHRYITKLSEAELAEMGASGYVFTPEEEAEAYRVASEIEAKDRETFSARFFHHTRIMRFTPLLALKTERQINTFASAVQHLIFSTAMLTDSVISFAWGYAHWHVIRSLIWRPALFAVYLSFPGFFHRARRGEFASSLNGAGTFRGVRSFLFIFRKDFHEKLVHWEAQIFEVEKEIQSRILPRSFEALAGFMKSPSEIQKMFAAGAPQAFDDKRLENFTFRQRMYFRQFFEVYYRRAMTAFLQPLMPIDRNRSEDFREMKTALLDRATEIHITPERAQEIVNSIPIREVMREAELRVDDLLSFKNARVGIRHRLQAALDGSHNFMTSRMNVVERQLKKPQAVERAMRATRAQNIIDKPLELMFYFLCFAAFQSGELAPVQTEMFSATSFFYLSRLIFLNTFLYGVVTGVLGDVWYKIQFDELNEEKFKVMPNEEEAKESFSKWRFKRTFQNPDNRYFKNWLNTSYFSALNMPAAFSNMFVMGMLTMHHFNFDWYFLSYLFLFFYPVGALRGMRDQGFEFSLSYYAKDFPGKTRATRFAQRFLSRKFLLEKLRFNVSNKTFENIDMNYVTALTMMPTKEYGTRSLSRILFGGQSITWHIVEKLNALSASAGAIPGVTAAAGICKYILTNRNTQWK